MAILGKSKICPFKEDSKLIKKINYKEHKFLKKFLLQRTLTLFFILGKI